AMVTGSIEGRTTIPKLKNNLNTVLKHIRLERYGFQTAFLLNDVCAYQKANKTHQQHEKL
ncbi:MAG: hypothetical protein RR716_00920, partial [Christensenellaceae bacterium]